MVSYRVLGKVSCLPARVGAIVSAAAFVATSITGVSAHLAIGSWRTAPGPPLPKSESANLTALAMAGPSKGWASGFTLANSPQNAPFEPLLAAWNGHRWLTVRVDVGHQGGRLDGLAAPSATDVWAVGTAYPNASSAKPLILHWDGRLWKRIVAANVPGYPYMSLLGVAAHSSTDAWAVGEAQRAAKPGLIPVIEHWNGHRWTLMADPPVPPMTALSGVAVAANGEAWAVGVPFIDTGHGVVLRWTGRRWVTASTPKTGGAVGLTGVTAVSPSNVWVVGSSSIENGPFSPYALHWDGHRWTSVAVPHKGEGSADWEFESVTSIGHGYLVAVGSDNTGVPPGRAVYGVWNGRAWSVNTGPHITQLNAVSYDGRHAVWAVGSVQTSGQAFQPVVQVNG